MAAPNGWWGGGNRRTLWTKYAGSGTAYEWYGFTAEASVGSPGTGYPSTPSGSDKWVLGLSNTGSTGWRAVAAQTVNPGWHFVAMIGRASADPQIHVDGNILAGGTAGPSGTRRGNSSGALRIGGSGFSTDYWLGGMSCLSFFTSALSNTQLNTIRVATSVKDAKSAIAALSPVACWDLQGQSMKDSIASHDGSVAEGSPIFGVKGPWEHSRGVWFDGESRIDIPDDDAWSASEFTICGWVNVALEPQFPDYNGWGVAPFSNGSWSARAVIL